MTTYTTITQHFESNRIRILQQPNGREVMEEYDQLIEIIESEPKEHIKRSDRAVKSFERLVEIYESVKTER